MDAPVKALNTEKAKALQARLVKEYNIQSLMSCSTCHR